MTVPLAFRPHPFADEVRCYRCAAGLSLAEMVAALPELPAGFAARGIVCINGVAVPRAMWPRVRPKPDHPARPVAVTLHVPLAGGEAGKSALRTVAAIAVFVAAAAVSLGALGPAGLGLFGPSFAAGGIGATVAGAAIALGGTLALAALAPPPRLPAPEGAAESARGAAALAGNVNARNRPVPRVIGTHRVFPPFLAEPLLELVGEDEYAEGIYGLAGPHALSDIRIGTTPIAQIAEAQFEVNQGTGGSGQIALVNRQGATDFIALELSSFQVVRPPNEIQAVVFSSIENQAAPATQVPFFHHYVTRRAPDEVWINMVWPEGLFYDKDAAKRTAMPLRLRLRRKGTATWIGLPEVHVTMSKVAPFQRTLKLRWGAAAPLPPPPPRENGFYLAYVFIDAQDFMTAPWTTHEWFVSGGPGSGVLHADTAAGTNVRNVLLYGDRAEFWLGGAAFPSATWEIQIVQGAPYLVENFTYGNYTMAGAFGPAMQNKRYDLFNFFTVPAGLPGAGTHAVIGDVAATHYRARAARIANVWNQHPVQRPDFASIGVRVKNRQLGELSVLASGLVRDWTGVSWSNLTATSNPAPHFRDILAGSLNADPLPVSLIDDANLVQWRARCISNGYSCDTVAEGRSVKEMLELVAAAGYARPRMSEKWGVMQDFDRAGTAPVQVFSPRNMRGFSFEKSFAARPDGLRVKFRDAANDYKESEIIVYDPQATQQVTLEEISYDALTSQAAAVARALFDLKQARLRAVFYSGEAPAEALVAVRGDLVAVQHDILHAFAGAARIKAVARASGRITSLTLDGSVPGPAGTGGSIAVQVRLKNGTLWTQTTNVGAAVEHTDVLTFAAPGPLDPGASLLTEDLLAVTGKAGSETRRLILFAAVPKGDLTYDLVFVDEAPALWA